jgi:hypothetical protein
MGGVMDGNLVDKISAASDWDQRVALIRQIPERYGRATQQEVYASIAEQVYVPHLTPDFAYVYPREDYELDGVVKSLQFAAEGTNGFTSVSADDLASAIMSHPESLLCFRLILAYTVQEFAIAATIVAEDLEIKTDVRHSKIKRFESGAEVPSIVAKVLAVTIDRAVSNTLFPDPGEALVSKQKRPDLKAGWQSVRKLFTEGVPYSMLLHQRHYGGAFRQLLDATSSLRGNVLEDAVESLFEQSDISYVRTGSANQADIEKRFSITVKPAPDFVVYSESSPTVPRVFLECKLVNDGGTARDKAGRFLNLREAGRKHGGVPVFAVLGGVGWRRVNDALGPVVKACDGRVFTLNTLDQMLTTEPLSSM